MQIVAERLEGVAAGPVAQPVAAEVGGVHVVVDGEVPGDPGPSGGRAGPAVQQDDGRGSLLAPLAVRQPDSARLDRADLRVQERRHRAGEGPGVVQPGEVPGAALDGELGVREERGQLRGPVGARMAVVLPGEDQDGDGRPAQGGGRRRGVEGPFLGVACAGLGVGLPGGRPGVGAGRLVPAAVGEGADGGPQFGEGTAGEQGVLGGPGLGVPGFVAAQFGGLAQVLAGHLDAHGPGARRHEGQGPQPLGVPGGVQQGQVRPGGVRQYVDPVEAEMLAQGLHVVDEAVAAVGRGVLGHGGVPGAAQVQQDEPPTGREPAEVAQIRARPHGPAGKADERLPLPHQAVGERGRVVRGEDRHARHPNRNPRARAAGFAAG